MVKVAICQTIEEMTEVAPTFTARAVCVANDEFVSVVVSALGFRSGAIGVSGDGGFRTLKILN
jgi:hypothetical protein